MSEIFMRAGGLQSVYIPYNMSDADLYPLLDQINGVYFTGGDLDLYDEETGALHPYSITGLKILNYAKAQKDQRNESFPLLGICQGHELLHILVANNTYALGWSTLENAHVNTNFLVDDPTKDSRMYSQFGHMAIDEMANEDILYHFHHRSVPVMVYRQFPVLSDFFDIISVNQIDTLLIVASAEARDYPIYVTQFHPEVVLEPAADINAVRTPMTAQIAFNFANWIAMEAQKSTHRFKDYETLTRWLVKNGDKTGKIEFVQELVNAYGFDY
jgi:gamma-glutamyl hydrolase